MAKTATILGKRWRLEFVPLDSRYDGECDRPDATGKSIKIRRSLLKQPRLLLEALIHEGLHAADYCKDEEEWVSPVAHDLARLLWNQGFRLERYP